jgi:hypothetical protein
MLECVRIESGATLFSERKLTMPTETRKYEFTGETKEFYGRTLHRIRALAPIASLSIMPGDTGGWIEAESNLTHAGAAWVAGEAIVCGKATIEGGTFRGGTFWGGTFRGGTFEGGTFRGGTFRGGTYQFVLMAQRTDGYVFTFNPDPRGPMVAAGCHYFTFPDAREHWKATRGGTQLGDESLQLLEHLEKMARLTGVWDCVEKEAKQ